MADYQPVYHQDPSINSPQKFDSAPTGLRPDSGRVCVQMQLRDFTGSKENLLSALNGATRKRGSNVATGFDIGFLDIRKANK